MNKKLFQIKLLAAVFALLSVLCRAQIAGEQNGAERALMSKFVELNNKKSLQSSEGRTLFGGEAAKEWKMEWFGQIFGEPDKIVSVEDGFSVARIQVVGKNSRVVDLYFYLRREAADGGWRIRAMRALAQTHFTEAAIEVLKGKTDLTATEKDDLANAELVLSADKTLAGWFQKKRAALDRAVTLAQLETKPKPVETPAPPKPAVAPKTKKSRRAKKEKNTVVDIDEEKLITAETVGGMENDEPRTVARVGADDLPSFPQTAAVLKSLHLSALEIKSDGNVEITIGGVTDNTVGFVYSPTDKPPPIDGWRYIWVEKVAAGWYLFRTT